MATSLVTSAVRNGPRRPLHANRLAPADRLQQSWNDFQWQIADGCASEAALFVVRDRFQQLCQAGDVSVVKSGPHRTVYRIRMSGATYYLKHFHPRGLWNWCKHLVRATRAEHEVRVATRLSSAGIPTYRPLLVGVKTHYGSACEALLISAELTDSFPLDDLLMEASRSGTRSATSTLAITHHRLARSERSRLATRLGKLIGNLHRTGIHHRDLHAGNVLLQMTPEGLAPVLIDLQAVSIRGHLSWPLRRTNLALFHHAFIGVATSSDRLRFWNAYQSVFNTVGSRIGQGSADACREPPHETLQERLHSPETRAQQIEVENALGPKALSLWQRADRAWERGNRHVRILRHGKTMSRGVATLPKGFLEEIDHNPQTAFRADEVVTICKKSARCLVALVRTQTTTGQLCFCAKRLKRRRTWKTWLLRWRWSAVRRAWETGHALLKRGIPTPRPLYVRENYTLDASRQTPQDDRFDLLVTEWIEDSLTGHDFVHQVLPTLDQATQSLWLRWHSSRIAWILRRMHAAGFDHRDLKLSNLLVSLRAGRPQVWLLDLDGVRRWERVPRQRTIQNLSRLELSARAQNVGTLTLRLRFLLSYLKGTSEDWRIWWKLVEQSGERKLVQNRLNDRPIN